MGRAPDKDAKIPCPTPQVLQAEFETLQAALDLGEGEHTWEKVDRGIVRFTAVVKGGGYKHANFVEGVGKHHAGLQLASYMLSDKGKLSGTTIDLLTSFAPRLNTSFAPLVPLYLDPIIKLLGRPNKVFIRRAEHCLGEIIANCPVVSIIYELKKGLENDAPTCRRGCAAAMVKAVQQWSIEVWGEKGVRWLEDGIRRMGGDKDAEVRATGKVMWGLFAEQWPERVDEFAAPLSPTTRRRLDIKSDATAAGKGTAAVKTSMAPPAVPHRTAPAAVSLSSASAPASASASSSTQHHGPLGVPQAIRNGHVRVKSTTQARPIDVPPARRAAPASSAPTSPTKDKTLQPILSRSHTTRPETVGLGLGQPSRPTSHHASSSTHRLPDKEIWSKPQRPQFTTSQSTPAVEDALAGPMRRFPPPSRGFRAPPAEDDLFNPSHAGPSVLRGPIRLPAPERAPPRLGPARRVVTAPYPSSQNPLAGPQRPTHPPASVSHNDLAAVLKGARSVKKRVEALEEEIRVNSPAGSPLPPRPSSAMGSSTPPGSLILGQRRIPIETLSSGTKVGGKTSTAAADSPLLPVLARSVDGRRDVQREMDRNDDLRRVSSGQQLADLTVMDVTVVPSRADLADAGEEDREEIPAADEADQKSIHTTEQEEADEEEEDHDDHAMTSIVVDLESDTEDRLARKGGEAEPPVADHTGATAILAAGPQHAGAAPNVEPVDGATANQNKELQEADREHLDEETQDQHPAHQEAHGDEQGPPADDGEHHEAAREVPLPSSPARSTITMPEDEPEPATTAAPLRPPPAPYPKEAPPRPRVVSRTGHNLTATTASTAARKAALPRKPALPPIVRRPANERKPFKPTSGASKAATKPPVPSAPVATVRVGSDKEVKADAVTRTKTAAAPTANPTPPLPSHVARAPASRPAATKPSVNAKKMNPPPMGVSGKGSTAPAVMARSVSAASTNSASTTSRPPKETHKPAVPKARPESKPDAKPKAPVAAAVTKPPARTNRPITSGATSTTAGTTAPAASSATAVIAGAAKIRRKAPLPSFKPVKARDKAAAATTGTAGRPGGKPTLKISTTATSRPKPESVPLPLSPGEKAKMAPRDIPLPRSPLAKQILLPEEMDAKAHEEEEEVEEVEELGADVKAAEEHGEDDEEFPKQEEPHPIIQDVGNHETTDVSRGAQPVVDENAGVSARHDGRDSATDDCDTHDAANVTATVRAAEDPNTEPEQITSIPIPRDTLQSPTTTMRPSSLRSSPSIPSPLAVSQPRTVSPVLTIALQDSPPATPASVARRRISSSAGRALSYATASDPPTYSSESFMSPVADSGSKLVHVPSPQDIPSPFLSAARRLSRSRYDEDGCSASSRFTSKQTEVVAPTAAVDGEEELEADDEVLVGVTTKIGQAGAASTTGAPITANKLTDTAAPGQSEGTDLMEFSASSRPAHGERKDVSTPVKGSTEVLLAKLAGKAGASVERVPLALRDSNTGARVGAVAAEGESDEE